MKTKKLLGELLLQAASHFFKFLLNIYVLIPFWGIPFLICSGIVTILTDILFPLIGVPCGAALLTKKVIMTIIPIFPTLICICCKSEDKRSFSTDLCFVAWFAVICWTWVAQ